MSRSLAAISGAAGAVALVVIGFFIWFCLFHKKNASRSSETGSSDPSIQVGRHVGVELALREARRFEMEELSSATKNFNDRNLIGFGKFGEVYKGLLNDGMLVAIKRRPGTPTQEFVDEVRYLAPIHHRNIVTLLGYCQEDNQQLLVYEYIPSGSVSSYLGWSSFRWEAGIQAQTFHSFRSSERFGSPTFSNSTFVAQRFQDGQCAGR